MVNVGIAILTTIVSVVALGVLIYAIFSKPDFGEKTNDEPKFPISPSRLSNNLIHPVPNKDFVIDLKGMGMETNEIVPVDYARNNREIEAHLHLEIEKVLEDSDSVSNETVSSTVQEEIQEAHLNLTTTPKIPSFTLTPKELPSTLLPKNVSSGSAPFSSQELSTIEPSFEKILAFPDCKRTKDGRKFC
ncbi:hypothetical protein FO519_001084 [Halicephalobus sp. NKZ332]|nr:hypothetical protein FO519_001084 [Halicephalobus sp. NKZ332]